MKQNQLTYIFLSLIAVSCHGQVKTDSPKTEIVKTVGQPKLVRSQGTDEYANVHCSLEDRSGNLWFGTTGEGLYKYDGKNFTNFLGKDGLEGKSVWCAYEDKAGKLWFGTDYGVSTYDPASNSFKTFSVGLKIITSGPDSYRDVPEQNAVRSMLQDKSGKFWFGTDRGLFTSDESPDASQPISFRS